MSKNHYLHFILPITMTISLFSNPALAVDANKSSLVVTAVGQYDSIRDKKDYPLIIQSIDGGTTWSHSQAILTHLPANYNGYGILNSIHCGNNSCIAVGKYRDKYDVTHPLFYRSIDKGITWSFITELPKDYSGDGWLNSVSCDGNVCIAVGEYRDENYHWKPMLAKSIDAGATWSYPKTIISNLPENAERAEFTTVNCHDKVCIAVGQYHLGINEIRPLLARSIDNGANWSYVLTLPSDYWAHGSLNSSKIS